ncbi:TonB-dependent receptor [Bacteroides stercorirosoris]|jgi:TonB-linked SusC/RagA family outer membrane protein|uniref:TonB-dependent receptor n=1 Tax=Bacteroides stercorirosoris TaxID=871324 RepID=A0A413HBI3_9BACE|nr:TonB-dependent receptor [Bacteroides stercorirosoris]RGX81103.1 TonB-dependent receptor [Bacteroides stercorirosoris]
MKRKAIYTLCSLFILFMMTGLCETATAQNITATGKVVDKNQEPLIGATVRIVGAQGGTITGMDGDFSLSCPSNSTLEISFVGYISQKVNAGTRLSIVLQEDAIALEETVIVGVGYGTMRKSDLTGAITSVNAKDMKQGIITSAEQLLQGKVAGLSVVQSSGAPEAGASIRLRGGTSLSASNGPLVVVDGIPGVDFNSVQPSEIVSIDVLKDASAAAIYGSRGANGVIIVTTNRAASDTEQKSIQYNGYVAIGQVAKHMDLLSADQWRAYVRENNVGQAIDYGADTDWQKELERTAISHSHNVAISNSRKDNGYRASITYQNNQGVIVRNSMNRLAGSLAAYQTGWNGRLRIEAGINANFDSWHPIDNRIFERMTNLNPTFPVYDQNGDFAQIGGTNTENPVEINANRADDQKRHRFLGYGKVELDLVKGLKAVANGSYEYQSTEGGLYKPTYAMMEGKSEKGWGQRTYAKYTNKQIETYLNYDLELARIHRMNFMAGYSYLINVYDGFGSSRSGFDTDAFLYNNLAAGSDFRAGDVYSYKGEAKLASFFGRINYNLMGKYMLTATLRRDGSSRFGTNHKWGTFPSVSLAWRISDEAFMESTTSWLNNLKLRAGYGVTGNQAGIGEYKSLAVLSADGASYYDAASGTWKKSYVQAQNVNPNLKWESTAQLNIGLDFGIFNRINGTIEFYHKKTSDLLWTYPVPQPPYQVGTMLANVGDLVNKGIEVSLSANILRQKDLTLDANVTFAYNDQEITKLSNDAYQAVGLQAGSLHGLRGMSGMYSQIIKEGYPSGAFYGPKCSGIDSDGNYIINRDEDGKPINEYLGSAQPKFNLGFGMNLTYRDFDFSFAGYGMFGQKVLNATRMAMFDPTRLPAQNVPDDFLESGIKSDPVFSSYFVENGSFFRLQSVTLGYTLPEVKKIGLEKIRFYLTGENLFCITGYSGIDPEVSLPDNVLEGPGIDRFNSYPRPRTFSLGVNISF